MWQACVAHVTGDVEAIVVDPDGIPEQRPVGHPLPEARHPRQPRRDVFADAVEVDAATGSAQGAALEDAGDRHVHRSIPGLETEKRLVQSGKPLEADHHARAVRGNARADVAEGPCSRLIRTIPASYELYLQFAAKTSRECRFSCDWTRRAASA
jgi:hypothetical protein